MVAAADAEDHVVAGEVDLDQHAFVGHGLQQLAGFVFVHHIDAVTDTVHAGLFHRKPDMAAQSFRRHEARRELSGMQADANLRIQRAQESDHAHLLGIVGHGAMPIFFADEIDGHDARIG